MKNIKINCITPIRIEYNTWNGFIFQILNIEVNNFEGELFGLHFSPDYLHISILFFFIEVKTPFIQ